MATGPPPLNYFDWPLSPEQQMIQGLAREFVDAEVLPIVGGCFERAEFPDHLIRRLGEMGFLGPTIPRYGAGLDHTSYGLICQELERGDSGLRSFASVQGSLCMYPISTYGSDEQQERYLPGMQRGELVGCFGLTEPDHGSDPGAMETRAIRDGDGSWVLNGTKTWITAGNLADVALIWARAQADTAASSTEIRGFLVETDNSGFTANRIQHTLSMRASVTSELVLQDCRIPASALLPGASGLRGPLSCLTQARFGIVFGVLGAAIACYEAALQYSQVREQWGQAIGGFQLTQEKLVDALQAITQGQLLAFQLGRLKDEGHLRAPQVSLAKRANCRLALDVARSMRSILGANGISLEYPIMRHMANLETVYTYEGTHEMHTLVVGQDVTGLSALRGAAGGV